MISIVRGNDFTLKIPVEIQRIESGATITEPFDLDGSEVIVNISNSFKRYRLDFTTEGNTVIIPIDGTKIGNGTYNVEIIAKKGDNFRSYKLRQFKIVESNEESNILSSAEFEVNVHQLDAHTLFDFSSKGVSKLSDLRDVDKSVDSAAIGSLLVKNGKWSPASPILSDLVDYDNMLMPVFHKVLGKWVFISVSSIAGGVTPPVSLEMVLDSGILNVNKLV